MRLISKRFAAIALLLCATHAEHASAASSLELAKLSRRAWAAFECSALADQTKNQAERARLFDIGYEAGKTFLEAVQKGVVDRKDISENVPWGMTAIMQGPNIDFMLGRLWEQTTGNALKKVFEREVENVPVDLWPLRAAQEFQTKNCALL